MSNNKFTSIPDASLSIYLLRTSNKKMMDLFNSYISCCESNLKISLGNIKQKIDSINCNKKIHPELFIFLNEISQSVKSGNVKKVKETLSNIEKSNNKNIKDIKIDSILTEDWEPIYIEHLRSYNQKTLNGDSTLVLPLEDPKEIEFHRSNIHEALKMIKAADEVFYNEFETFVSYIKFFKGRVLRGDTSAKGFGSMWIRVPEPEDDQVGYWIEHIVHETSHIRLESHFLVENLVLNSNKEEIFKAPIRDDPRPMRGIYHATFVLSRMVRIFKRLSKNGYENRFRDRLQLCRLQFDIGYESLHHEMAKLSKNAIKVRSTLLECKEN